MLRNNQKFLITVEDLSGFTWIDEIEDQTAEVIKQRLLQQILAVTPEQGAVIRTDGASSFQTLAKEAETPSTVWAKHSILFDIGEKMNVNRNPVAENKIREVHKEFLRHSPEGGKLTPVQVAEVAKTLNARIRSAGLASREILLSRALFNNKVIKLGDEDLAKEKTEQREYQHSAQHKHQVKQGAVKVDPPQLEIGDLVLLRTGNDKTKVRDQFIIHSIDREKNLAVVRKAQSQLQAKTYPVDLTNLISLNYFRPGPQLSADMSKTDSETPTSEITKRKEGKEERKSTEKEKKTKKRKERKASNSENVLTSGNGKGAPNNLNAAGRPRREAAAKAYKAWIQSVSCSPDLIKPPWLQEDQPDDDEEYTISDPQSRYHPHVHLDNEVNILMGIDWDQSEHHVDQEVHQVRVHMPRIPELRADRVARDDDELEPERARDPEASDEASQLAVVNSAPQQQDLSRAESEDSTVAYEGSSSEQDLSQDNLHFESVSEQSTLELPPQAHLRVALGPGAPAQDLAAALDALAPGPPLPPRGPQHRQRLQQEAQRQSSRQRGKTQPDYKTLHESGKGGL